MISISATAIKARGAQEDLVVSVADAGIDEYDLEDTGTVGVETFDERDLVSGSQWAPGGGSLDFEGDAGAFSGVGWIQSASVYGGANSNGGATGRHATANTDTIILTMPDTSDYRYVGFWWSAGNSPNDVQLILEDGTVGATFSVDIEGTEDLAGLVGDCRTSQGVYCGNRNYDPIQVTDEPFAFVHLRYEPGFREVRFSGNGFEFDNVTVSQTVPDFSATETTVESFDPFTLATPLVLIADPRATSVSFPGVTLTDGTDEEEAMICFSQVTQGGGALVEAATIQASGIGTGITVATDTNLVAFSGARDTVVDFSPAIFLEGITQNQQFGVTSVFIQVSATPQTNSGTAGCSGSNAVSAEVEVRFLNTLQSNSLNIPIN
jgi:hypothetical protein